MQCIYESKRKNIGKGVSIPYRVHAMFGNARVYDNARVYGFQFLIGFMQLDEEEIPHQPTPKRSFRFQFLIGFMQ